MREPGYESLRHALATASDAGVGGPTLAEAALVLKRGAGVQVRTPLLALVAETGLTTLPFGDGHRRVALDAFVRYGEGRHPAALNFGDRLTDAVAKVAQQPLLCVGGDFARTDLALA